ncbi:MAG: hypothetical protein GY862_36395 [Gammaproteobacteria bacterium]|nr:hypothetical protein [Gammaproteobacteria bacterium]
MTGKLLLDSKQLLAALEKETRRTEAATQRAEKAKRRADTAVQRAEKAKRQAETEV